MKIEVNSLEFAYGKKNVFSDVSFLAKENEFVCILGANGSGKSTFLNCICKLIKPKSGIIKFDEKNIDIFSRKSLAKHISYVPQNYNPVYDCSIKDFLLMGRNPYSIFPFSYNSSDIAMVNEILEHFNLIHDSEKSISKLSGGERKRILLIRALVQDTPTVILDEPTNQLDFGMRVKFLELLKTLSQQGKCIIITTHSPDDALNYSDKIMLFSNGSASMFLSNKLSIDLINSLYNVEAEIVHGECIDLKSCIARSI